MGKKTIKAIIVGAGDRGLLYSMYAKDHPSDLKIVGVVDPDKKRRMLTADIFHIPDTHCFQNIDRLLDIPRISDAVINGTMDKHHVSTTIPLLEKGYYVLLEKPIATNLEEMQDLMDAWKRSKSKLMIGHVLRYAPFYRTIYEKLQSGIIGDIINIETKEYISYDHMGVAYLRGKWRSKKICGSTILMSKCCHDLDILTWFKDGIMPVKVASFGSNMRFNSKNSPGGSGNRCLVDCKIEKRCPFSARNNYIYNPERWANYVWKDLQLEKYPVTNKLTKSKMEYSLKTDNPYGLCVWKSGSNVMDHQVVTIYFKDGTTATHTLVGGTSRASRTISITGTKGEIEGRFEDAKFIIRLLEPRKDKEINYNVVDVTAKGVEGPHGGGDMRLIENFINYIRDDKPGEVHTSLEETLPSHLIGFFADKSLKEGKIYKIPDELLSETYHNQAEENER